MPRPTLLIAEPEPGLALSTRKLVLETAKFNVLTAHTTGEAIEIFELFPSISMAVVVMNDSIDCPRVARLIKDANSKIPVVGLKRGEGDDCEFVDQTFSIYDPESLLEFVRAKLGDPRFGS